MYKNIIIAMSIISMILLAGCLEAPEQPPVTKQITSQTSLDPGTFEEKSSAIPTEIKTQQFKREDEFLDMIQNSQGSNGYYDTLGMTRNMAVDTVMEEAAPMASKTESVANGGADDFSQTNNQVENVDEADILKTDGDYIYTISNNVLFIVKAYPGEDAKVLSDIDFESNRPQGIFIDGDHMAVFGNFYDNDWYQKVDFSPRSGMTFYNIYDVSNRSNPELLKEYKFEGNYYNGRLLDGYSYILVRNNPYSRPVPMPYYWDGITRHNLELNDMYYYNIPYNYPQMITVHSINLNDIDEDVNSKAVMVEGSQNMYMSENSIYVTYSEYINEYELQTQITIDLLAEHITDADKKIIKKIKETDNDVLSQYEKEQKINQIYLSYLNFLPYEEQEDLQDEVETLLKKKIEEMEYFEYTVINKIDINDGDIDPVANGKVPGHMINQFSMDEFDDVLRIGTTVSARWSRFGMDRTKSMNNIYALDDNLEVIGELEGLAKGESIYSTRFIEERLYMVTFRQVDPFFVIDLSDPTDIKEIGQLKIPGFSRYLHPYDENTIIGIGQDATNTGRTTGLKISLFDVSDVENPKEISKYVTDERYAQSTALYEHKAFLFSKEKHLLVIPAYSYDYDWREPDGSSESYNGAFVFHIDTEQIKLRGLIDHSMSATNTYQAAVERSLYIEENLYTKSPNLLRINALDDLHSVKNVELKKTSGKIIIY